MSGDAIDIDGLVTEHEAGLWRYLRFLGCPPSQAEDLAQETFLIVLKKDFVHRSRAQTASYLRATARNLFLAHLRRSARIQTVEDLDVADSVWVDEGGDDDGGATRLRALSHCLEELPEGRGRTALDLRYRQGQSMNDIGTHLSIEEGNVRVLLHRTRQTLRRCLEQKMPS